MANRDLIRLKHMLDSAEAVLSFIEGKTRQQLDTERLLASGIIRELEILGEAAVAITQETKEKFPELPWKQVVGMRNRLIHAYFDIDYDIVWKTICEALPPLVKQLQRVILVLSSTTQ